MHVRFSLAFGDAARLPSRLGPGDSLRNWTETWFLPLACVWPEACSLTTWFSEFPSAAGNGISALMEFREPWCDQSRKNLVRVSRFVGQQIWWVSSFAVGQGYPEQGSEGQLLKSQFMFLWNGGMEFVLDWVERIKQGHRFVNVL